MMNAEFAYPLENGGEISDSEILQPFMVYRPKLNQSGLKEIFILTDERGIRIYNKENSKRLYSCISKLVDRKYCTLQLVDRFVGERAVIDMCVMN